MAFTASRNFSVTCPSTTGEGIGLPNCSRMNVTNPPDVASWPDVAVQVQPVQAFHFQRDVSVQQFRDIRHARILRNPETGCSSV